MRILFYAYGNPGRQDDGLGIAFVKELEKYVRQDEIEGVSFDTNYQLNIEDADTIKDYDIVIFVDASQEDIPLFCITDVSPSEARTKFTMHAVSPAFILDLCQKLYNKFPRTYLLHIKGYEWDFQERLSTHALQNLSLSLKFIQYQLQKGTLTDILAGSSLPCM